MTSQRWRIIVAGGGQTGLDLSEGLVSRGHQVVIIERDPDRCETLNDRYIASVIEGDATDPTVLAQADPETADGLVAVTGSPTSDLVICRVGREFGVPVSITIGDKSLADTEVEGITVIEDQEEMQQLLDAVVRQISESEGYIM